MNDTDVARQIQQMVRFLHKEAEEKANEISISAEEEFNIVKFQILEVEKKKIRQEYERKYKQVEVRRKIEYSMQLNASRVKVLQAQHDLVSAMKEAASKELLQVRDHRHLGHHQNYEEFVVDLILQGLLRLKEAAVLLRCREDDLNVLNSAQLLAKKEYEEKTNLHPPEIIVDNIYLPPAPSDEDVDGPLWYLSGFSILGLKQRSHVTCGSSDFSSSLVHIWVGSIRFMMDHGYSYLESSELMMKHHSYKICFAIFISGGVVLASKDGKIVFDNSLEARLEVVFRKKLPLIRKMLYTQIAA